MNFILKWFRKIQAEIALDDLASLEKRRSFISPFFMGHTAYEVELERYEKRLKKAQEKYDNLKQYLD